MYIYTLTFYQERRVDTLKIFYGRGGERGEFGSDFSEYFKHRTLDGYGVSALVHFILFQSTCVHTIK
jgi:hypothetical protein